MFEFVRTHNRLLFFVLVLLILPSFVFFGVQGYSGFNDPSSAAVAKVDGQKVTRAEWDAQHKLQVERLRDQAPGMDLKLFDTPEARRQTLDNLMRERVLFAAAVRSHARVSDERLMRELQSVPELAALRRPDGSFDVAAYKVMVESRGRTTENFEAAVRQEILLRQVLAGVSDTAPNTQTLMRSALEALLQQREAQVIRFDSREQAASINPSAADMEAYHKEHESEFRAPEQASIEYVVLDLSALQKDLALNEADLRSYYETHKARFTVVEERRASHILVAAAKDAPADVRAKAKAKAEALLAQLRQTPSAFAELASKNSDDPLSAARGGDLEFSARGGYVSKAQEDAVFAMKPGEIGNVVETEFGFHIIRLDAVRGGDVKSFDAVRAEIETEVRKQQASKRFAEAAELFTNTVSAQADSLQPVADKLKLERRTATVQRTPLNGMTGVLASPKLLAAVFADDVLKNKLNTEAIEVGGNQMVAARVVQHFPSRLQPLSEVQEIVRARVVAQQAAAKAKKAGEARLTELRSSNASTGLPAPVLVSRTNPQGQPRAVVDAVLRADPSQLPQWLGVDLGDAGYAVVRVNAVKAPSADSPEFAALAPRYTQAWSAAESSAYYKALERRFKAVVLPEAQAAAASSPAP